MTTHEIFLDRIKNVGDYQRKYLKLMANGFKPVRDIDDDGTVVTVRMADNKWITTTRTSKGWKS